jgi:hypothetical protein
MAGHIIHFTVAACRQPFPQAGHRVARVGPRHADGGKAELFSGLADFSLSAA